MINPLKWIIIPAFLFILNLAPFVSLAQSKSPGCADLKNGIFHFYPKNSADHYLEIRDGEFLHEITTNTNDTALWQVKWTSDCVYTLKYISGNGKITEETVSFLKKHKMVYEILNVTNDYYVFKGYVDKTSNLPIQADTMWLSEKVNHVNNELVKQIPNNAALKKSHFSDTSKYAVLYVYRPGKVMNSAGNYLIYLNENIICVAKNESGYIFKILKEGRFELKSRLYKDESAVNVDIKFGNAYYVKSMIHWGIYSRLYNFKLEMAMVGPDIGKAEFADVNVE